jgi:hypothetical protein
VSLPPFEERLRKFVLTELAGVLQARANELQEIEDGIAELEEFEVKSKYGTWG